MSLPTPSGNPRPDPNAPQPDKPPADGNPKTAPLEAPAAEVAKFYRMITACRSAVKLLLIQSGRVLATCTAPPANHPPGMSEKTQWSAGELAELVPGFASDLAKFDGALQDFEKDSTGARVQAIGGTLK